jgi:acetyl-CoA synthetase
MGHVARARFWQDLRPGDLHWNAAAELLFGQMHERACSLQVAAGQLDADATLGILSRHRVTSFSATPTLYRAVVYGDFAKYDLSALRHCTSAGEPLNPEVMRAWSEGTGGLAVYDGYGQTETTVPVANYRSVEVRPGSMGRAMPGWDIAVVDDDGAPAATGEVANLVIRYDPVRPVGLFPGYLGDPDATAAVFRAPYYFTGDRAAMDVDGYVWFEGRNDDVIKAGTRSLGPFEVESVLLEHPAVMEAAVVGRDGQHQAQIVVAVCVLAPGPYTASSELAGELHEFIKQSSAAAYKHPREIYFVDKLPKTSSGKIRRTEVREQLRAGTLSKLEPTL